MTVNSLKVLKVEKQTLNKRLLLFFESLLSDVSQRCLVQIFIRGCDKIFLEVGPLARVRRLPDVELGVCVALGKAAFVGTYVGDLYNL